MFESGVEKSTSKPQSITADIEHLLDGIHSVPVFPGRAEKAPHGAETAPLHTLALMGGFSGLGSGVAGSFGKNALAGATNGEVIASFGRRMFSGVVLGASAAAAEATTDKLMQWTFGHNIYGHDLFRPTGLEMLGFGVAAGVPMDIKLKLGVAGASWLAGRIENFFDA